MSTSKLSSYAVTSYFNNTFYKFALRSDCTFCIYITYVTEKVKQLSNSYFSYFNVAHPLCVIKYKLMLQSVNTILYLIRIMLHVTAKMITYNQPI
jgi:hypothetical protein